MQGERTTGIHEFRFKQQSLSTKITEDMPLLAIFYIHGDGHSAHNGIPNVHQLSSDNFQIVQEIASLITHVCLAGLG